MRCSRELHDEFCGQKSVWCLKSVEESLKDPSGQVATEDRAGNLRHVLSTVVVVLYRFREAANFGAPFTSLHHSNFTRLLWNQDF